MFIPLHFVANRRGVAKPAGIIEPPRDIPSAGESGVAGLNIAAWFGFYAPKGTPADVVGKLNAAMVAALADPAVKARFARASRPSGPATIRPAP